jgi:hypothetical protein
MINPDLTPPRIGVLQCQKKYCRSLMPDGKPNPDYICTAHPVGSNERFACEDSCKDNCVKSGGKRPGTTATTNIFNYPYIVGRINQDSMDSEISSIQSILAQKKPEQDVPIFSFPDGDDNHPDCHLMYEPEITPELTPQQRGDAVERCCVGYATLILSRIPSMRHLFKCQLFQSCKRDCIAVGDLSFPPCDIKCEGYLPPPVMPDMFGTIERITYCENLIREYEKKYKIPYEAQLKDCKRQGDNYRNPPTTDTA